MSSVLADVTHKLCSKQDGRRILAYPKVDCDGQVVVEGIFCSGTQDERSLLLAPEKCEGQDAFSML